MHAMEREAKEAMGGVVEASKATCSKNVYIGVTEYYGIISILSSALSE